MASHDEDLRPAMVHNPGYQPDIVSPHAPEWTVKTAQAVRTFADNLWSRDPDKQDTYVVKHQLNNDSAGRGAWKDWVKASLKKRSLNKAVDEVLIAANRSPYDIMAIHRKHKVSTILLFHFCY